MHDDDEMWNAIAVITFAYHTFFNIHVSYLSTRPETQ